MAMEPRTRTRRHLLMVAVAVVLGGDLPRAQIIDRVMAVVSGAIITQSDVLAAIRLGTISSSGPAMIADTLDRLIERRLMLVEAERFAPPEPDPAQIDARLAAMAARFGAEPELDRTLGEFGLTRDQLRRGVHDDLRLETYLRLRFGEPLPPSEDDILRYYQDHAADYVRNGVPRPFSDVHDEVRSTMTGERRQADIKSWIAGLRRRADVTVMIQPTR
jgi:hypothetical protein